MKRRNVLFIILGIVIVIIIHNYIDDLRSEVRDELNLSSERLSKELRLKEKISMEIDEAESKRIVSGILKTPTSSGAVSRLHSHISQLMRSSGLDIVTVRTNPVVKYRYYEGISITLEARGTPEDILRFLKKVYNSDMAITLKKISIIEMKRENPEDMKITLDIEGLRRL